MNPMGMCSASHQTKRRKTGVGVKGKDGASVRTRVCVCVCAHMYMFLGEWRNNLCFACMLSCFNNILLFEALWKIANQASLSMEFSRQDYWCGLPCPPPGALPDPGIKPVSLASSTL